MIDRPRHLQNTVQHYDWGSRTAIPEMLGDQPDGRPHAELWLGAHPSGSSRLVGEDLTPLQTAILSAPERTLGARVIDEFGPRLPYLMKVLSAESALSIQVHPRPHDARAGYNSENVLGLPPGDTRRSFHDDQHKPEMIVALSQFDGLAGFRQPRAILRLLAGLPGRLVATMRSSLEEDSTAEGMRRAFSCLLDARGSLDVGADIETTLEGIRGRVATSPSTRADATVAMLAKQHPGDPGALASLMLNRFTLEPGEALFIPSGEIHAYLSGTGVEIMASSDNVLRAGLTTKLVDTGALLACASFTARPPVAPTCTASGEHHEVRHYRAPVAEFALVVAESSVDDDIALPSEGPRIVLCLDGAVALSTGGEDFTLEQGQSVFVPHVSGRTTVRGDGQIVCAYVP
ncbi:MULTISPECIES: mannose-6-phosphate isomerase, class I [Oerskovia]|uniref:mannose-6-phosphate isomerase n=2 Tax=Oerskovia TaxID=162491 RepID=A0ABR8V338_9CELL|nr:MULTISPECIES: mannose-6-phosphate isomerase, class I [Oerskovia]MBD7999188.1 mannose-6-phosphate isomerase, class I [Oerskovia gallyi]MBM7498337.1 mannose-6-phosphate isomerase [Oerskovia paurometabola]